MTTNDAAITGVFATIFFIMGSEREEAIEPTREQEFAETQNQ